MIRQLTPIDSPLLSDIQGQDLRSSGGTRLSRGSFIRCARIIIFILLDSILLFLARAVAETYGTSWNKLWDTRENFSVLVLVLSVQLGFLFAKDLYKSGWRRRHYTGIVTALTLANILLLLIAFLYFPQQLISRSTFLLSWGFSVAFVCAGRFAADTIVKRVRQKGVVRHPVFVFCHPDDAEKAASLLGGAEYYQFGGWADVTLLEGENLEATLHQINQMGISEVFVCSRSPLANPMFLYWILRNAGITLYILSLEVGLNPLLRDSEFTTFAGVPCFRFAAPAITGIDFKVKRILDFCFGVIVLVLASPIYILLSILIKLDSPGPIFYRQTRVGLHSRPFKVWKFRTMVTNADQLQKQLEQQNQTKDGILFKMKDDPRVTRIGRFLRQYSLDELPQIFNVLVGEMSFVGPRPLPVRDVEKFSEHHFIRHEVLPGITGLWQVSGRSDIDNFEDVLRLDIRYIENWSLWLDLRIVFKTVQVILRKTGAY